MYSFENDEVKRVTIGNKEERKLFCLDSGGLRTSFCEEDSTYVIQRVDGSVLDGYIEYPRVVYGEMQWENTLEVLLEQNVSSFVMLQNKREAQPFVEFDYLITDDHKKIIIYPVYIDRQSITVFDGPYIREKDYKEVNLMLGFGTRIRCRKSLNEEQKLSLTIKEPEFR